MKKRSLLFILILLSLIILLSLNILAADGYDISQKAELAVFSAVFIIILIIVLAYTGFKLKEARAEIVKNKTTDAETGIGNRLYFERKFASEISDFSRELYFIAYIILDVNCLEVYHGEHSFSDVVKKAARLLHFTVEYDEFAARITENSFALAFKNANAEKAVDYIEELIAKLNSFVSQTNKKSKPVFYASLYNLKKTDSNCEVLLFNLRRNCNKLIGTDEKAILCDEHNIHGVKEEKILVDNIVNGLKNNEFKLYLQLIIDTKSKRIASAEALSRWIHPTMGLLTPAKYIDAMNNNGLISELDYYMFETACDQLEKWSKTEFSELSISCNFTRITISEEDFIAKIADIASKYTFDRAKLIIEITEDAIEKNLEEALLNVSACKTLGFRAALDDLGSGYTSLSNLCDYPVDIVKIDRDILLKADHKKGADLIAGMVALAHNLNLKVVCEGVETKEQNELVTKAGCDFIQGWFYSRILAVSDAEAFIKNYNKSLEYQM